ncbi:MAG: hypothetical protein K2X77_16345 [Candidatus Obscuribacterales bacterium]|nr:hypothetical protein [Candidatus Obscuribacterales bacterium]
MRVFNKENTNGLSVLIKVAGPALLFAERSIENDSFNLVNVWGEPAIVFVYEGEAFQSVQVGTGDELRVAGIEEDDLNWLPKDSVARTGIIAPMQIPGAKIAKNVIDRPSFYASEQLFHCRYYQQEIPEANFEMARRSIREECSDRKSRREFDKARSFVSCGCGFQKIERRDLGAMK